MIQNREFFMRGKRGVINTGFIGKKKVAIKTKRPGSEAIGRIKNESEWLKKLNKYNIGPKFISYKDDELVYEFVEGSFILDYFENNDKRKIKKVIKDIFEQVYKMDKLKVNKLEMHHPVKHIVIGKKPVLLDFEKCRNTDKPKNVTQFCQFLISNNVRDLLKDKGIEINKEKIIELAKKYKKKENRENLKNIIARI